MRRSPIILATTIVGTAVTLMFRPHAPTVTVDSGTDDSSVAASESEPAAEPGSKATGTTKVTGAGSTTQYGTTQVRVTITKGKITDVTTLKSDNGDAQSLSITTPALPKLRRSALTKQSAKIDAVSGATFTSQAYQASLQSALDKAGFKA
jgi:uncharacterized protein with FMN-binding domain